jgi:uncharacterized membrane protein YgdD (TMEM256/DUF423 family)
LTVLVGAISLHGLDPKSSATGAVTPIFNAGQLYHALHALALLGVALLLGFSQDRRSPFVMLRLAAIGFTGGILLYSGCIYVDHYARVFGGQCARSGDRGYPAVPGRLGGAGALRVRVGGAENMSGNRLACGSSRAPRCAW